MTTSLQAVVFDMDDTLYAERDFVLSGFHAVAQWADEALGIPATAGYEKLTNLFHIGVRGDTFNRWLELFHQPADETLVRQLVQVYRGHTPHIRPFPEIPALLQDLRQHVRVGLISDGYLQVQQRKLHALGLADYFDAVIFSDRWGRAAWKPSERPFRTVLQQLDVPARAAVYVGDNPSKDFLGARRVGMSTVWLRRADGEYSCQTPPTPDHAPHQIIAALQELPQILAIPLALQE